MTRSRRLYHGCAKHLTGIPRVPLFMAVERYAAEWFAGERGDGPGFLHVFITHFDHPIELTDRTDYLRLIGLARAAGVSIESDIEQADNWDFYCPDIAQHSPCDGTNPIDLLYIPAVQTALLDAGYDSAHLFDTLENTAIETFVALRPEKVQLIDTYPVIPAPTHPA